MTLYMHGVNQLRGWSRKVGLLGHGRGRPLLSVFVDGSTHKLLVKPNQHLLRLPSSLVGKSLYADLHAEVQQFKPQSGHNFT